MALCRDRRLGPARIAGILGLHPSTVHRVLSRHELPRLAWLDRPTGQPVRRYERGRPGELADVDPAPASSAERDLPAVVSALDEVLTSFRRRARRGRRRDMR